MEHETDKEKRKMSLWSYLSSEVTRGYQLEHDEDRYRTRREKMYTFMKIPRELEKFMSYGFFHCLDSFLFVFTFLPLRFGAAVLALFGRAPLVALGLFRPYHGRVLHAAEIIDLLKGLIISVCVYAMSYIDTSMMYHIIKSQSVIKLYLFYNMLEVGDRLFSAFGQDTIDALFWTATEPRGRKREHIGVIAHLALAITYVFCHTLLVLLQATTLNVAINASNKALLTIMMSNNFVELKGSVFKKFDKNNLFQVSCSDVRERFHLFALLFVVVVQTMKEYGWKEDSFWSLAPDCLMVLGVEFVVDWIKHAFITRFNEVSAEVYKDYTTSLAYDLAQTKQKHAFSDHSDLVSRRMGFIPLPLGVVMIRVIGTAVKGNSRGGPIICLLAYLCLVTFRILGSIVILGKACDLIDHHQQAKTPSSTGLKSVSEEPAKEEVAIAESGDGRKPIVTSGDDRKLPETSGAGQRIDEIGPDISLPDTNLPDATPPPDSNLPDSKLPDSNLPDSNLPDATPPDSNLPDTTPRDSPPPDMSVPADLEIPDLYDEPKLGLLNNSDVKMSCAVINQGEASAASFGSLEDSDEDEERTSGRAGDEEITRGRAGDEEMTLHHVARGNSPSVVEVEVGQQLGQQDRILPDLLPDDRQTSEPNRPRRDSDRPHRDSDRDSVRLNRDPSDSSEEESTEKKFYIGDEKPMMTSTPSKTNKETSKQTIKETATTFEPSSLVFADKVEEVTPLFRPKAMSSPDFMKPYRDKKDENDWPVIDSSDEEQPSPQHRQKLHSVCEPTVDSDPDRKKHYTT